MIEIVGTEKTKLKYRSIIRSRKERGIGRDSRGIEEEENGSSDRCDARNVGCANSK